MEKIAIFGGAFNPPTLGHKKVIEELLEKKVVSKIIICPDGTRDDKDYKIQESQREEMIHIFFQDLVAKGFCVELDLHFFKKKGFTTTYDVNAYFEKKLSYMPYHIFGSDTIAGFSSWSGNPDKFIEKKLKKLFVTRFGYTQQNFEGLENYTFVEINSPEISSTQVRTAIQEKKSISQFVSAEIESYIQNHGLYR